MSRIPTVPRDLPPAGPGQPASDVLDIGCAAGGGRIRSGHRQLTTADRLAACARRLAAELQTLPDKPEETPDTTLRTLAHLACGRAMTVAAAGERPLPPLISPDVMARLEALVVRRLSGVPLAHLTRMQRFMELDFHCGPEALIPRKETELLGYAALNLLRDIAREREAAVVVDVCTGSGNLALAMAHHEPGARVFASDLSPAAVALARRNAALTRLEGRVEIRQGDLLAPFEVPAFRGQVDLLLCNPPYISSKKVDAMPAEIARHEPRLAFDGGPFGITILRRLIDAAPRFLRSDGWLAFEVGLGQGPAILRRLRQSGSFAEIRSVADNSGQVRAALARR